MKNADKYRPLYHMPPEDKRDLEWMKKDRLDFAPLWCSVDLRDGNQSLIVPMSIDDKLRYFRFLVELGFKEIEVGFPAASETEFDFIRTLIDDDLIPEDVTIQVLSQSRPHIIERTFESIKGAKNAIVHLYNSTSTPQRQQVFRMDEDEIIAIAIEGAMLFNEYASKMPETKFAFQYSPESFTGTEMDFALRICNAVIDVWIPTKERKVIINLPATVETSMPHVYAQQIAFMSRNLRYRDNVIVSIHPHNDRGTGVAATEMALLAGAQRVEGTIFGNGERTGNVDIVTLALNLYTHGVPPELDFSDMPEIVKTYEQINRLSVGPRQPYAGELVFAAFSGSHQDAIAKGMQFRSEHNEHVWTVPYLPIDPGDVNREYEADVIRINSQSGKGGVSYILESNFGFKLPTELRKEVGGFITDISDKGQKEMSPKDIYNAFEAQYINLVSPLNLTKADWHRQDGSTIADIDLVINGNPQRLRGTGNGPLDAVSSALRKVGDFPKIDFRFEDYEQHSIGAESNARAAAYVKITENDGTAYWGVGVHNDTSVAGLQALLSAVNRKNHLAE